MRKIDLEILDLAGAFYRYEAHRQQAARERFDLGPTAFWQRVNRLLDDPDAAIARPVVVARLRRTRLARQRDRSSRRAG